MASRTSLSQIFGSSIRHPFLPLVFLAAIASSPVCGQEPETPKTLAGNTNLWISGFGGPLVEFSSLVGNSAVGAGGGGAALFGNRFFIGGYGVGMTVSNVSLPGFTNASVSFGHGGLWTGFIIKPVSLVHGGISSKFGWGEISVFETLAPGQAFDQVFVVQPQAEVELNVTHWFKFNVGLGYRWVSGIDNTAIAASDIDSMTGTLTFIFGWFRPRRG